MKQDRKHHHHQQQQQQQHKQRKKKQIQDDDDTAMTESTQEYSLASEKLESNLIDDKDDKCDNNFVIIPTQVLFRMKQNLN